VLLDLLGFGLAWGFTSVLGHDGKAGLVAAAVATAVAILVMWVQRLYLSRVAGSREVELSRTLRTVLISAIAFGTTMNVLDRRWAAGWAVLGGLVAFGSVTLLRGVYAAMLRQRRARGLNTRPVVIVGAGEEAREVIALMETHPESGFRAVGVIGDPGDDTSGFGSVPLLGDTSRAFELVGATGVHGVVLCIADLRSRERNDLTQRFMASNYHVHLSTGMNGIDLRRLCATDIAQEPLYYMEQSSHSKVNLAVKRIIDLCIGVPAFIVSLPILAVAAVAIKLDDRGPVFFRQTRVGRDGALITIPKLRTMVPNAEELLGELKGVNERQGALFKLKRDPRRTRVGRILEAASLDELPQLACVIKGSMSLVGPRPALPSEVAEFDDELLGRLSMPPGVTGLWQIQARDNSSFDAYRRLDLFYVNNWSLSMDAAILIETVTTVLSRLVLHSDDTEADVPSMAPPQPAPPASVAPPTARTA